MVFPNPTSSAGIAPCESDKGKQSRLNLMWVDLNPCFGQRGNQFIQSIGSRILSQLRSRIQSKVGVMNTA